MSCAAPVLWHLFWRDVGIAHLFEELYGVGLDLGFVCVWGHT